MMALTPFQGSKKVDLNTPNITQNVAGPILSTNLDSDNLPSHGSQALARSGEVAGNNVMKGLGMISDSFNKALDRKGQNDRAAATLAYNKAAQDDQQEWNTAERIRQEEAVKDVNNRDLKIIDYGRKEAIIRADVKMTDQQMEEKVIELQKTHRQSDTNEQGLTNEEIRQANIQYSTKLKEEAAKNNDKYQRRNYYRGIDQFHELRKEFEEEKLGLDKHELYSLLSEGYYETLGSRNEVIKFSQNDVEKRIIEKLKVNNSGISDETIKIKIEEFRKQLKIIRDNPETMEGMRDGAYSEDVKQAALNKANRVGGSGSRSNLNKRNPGSPEHRAATIESTARKNVKSSKQIIAEEKVEFEQGNSSSHTIQGINMITSTNGDATASVSYKKDRDGIINGIPEVDHNGIISQEKRRLTKSYNSSKVGETSYKSVAKSLTDSIVAEAGFSERDIDGMTAIIHESYSRNQEISDKAIRNIQKRHPELLPKILHSRNILIELDRNANDSYNKARRSSNEELSNEYGGRTPHNMLRKVVENKRTQRIGVLTKEDLRAKRAEASGQYDSQYYIPKVNADGSVEEAPVKKERERKTDSQGRTMITTSKGETLTVTSPVGTRSWQGPNKSKDGYTTEANPGTDMVSKSGKYYAQSDYKVVRVVNEHKNGVGGGPALGNLVVLEDKKTGDRVLYAHFDQNSIPFKAGDDVPKGSLLGTAHKSSGSGSAPHIKAYFGRDGETFAVGTKARSADRQTVLWKIRDAEEIYYNSQDNEKAAKRRARHDQPLPQEAADIKKQARMEYKSKDYESQIAADKETFQDIPESSDISKKRNKINSDFNRKITNLLRDKESTQEERQEDYLFYKEEREDAIADLKDAMELEATQTEDELKAGQPTRQERLAGEDEQMAELNKIRKESILGSEMTDVEEAINRVAYRAGQAVGKVPGLFMDAMKAISKIPGGIGDMYNDDKIKKLGKLIEDGKATDTEKLEFQELVIEYADKKAIAKGSSKIDYTTKNGQPKKTTRKGNMR